MDPDPSPAAAIVLRYDQWDLIVLALDRIRAMTTGDTNLSIDRLARLFLKRRCIEAISDIQAIVPQAGQQ